MRLIDPHLHVEALNHHSLELMALAGIEAVISMVAVPEAHKDYPSAAIFEHCERVRSYHAWRTEYYFGIKTFGCIGISMVGVPVDYEEGLARMRDYLKEHPNEVFGIGEIGIEPSSTTCPDLKVQERIMREQIEMARDFSKPVVLHTPPREKGRWVAKYLPILKEHKLNLGQAIFDHCEPSVVNGITSQGCFAALTVQPWRKVRPADAAQAVKAGDPERILIDSDCSLLESDPLSVPKAVLEMRKLGIAEAVIQKVVWENPKRIYRLPVM
jgi:hypothetical protein